MVLGTTGVATHAEDAKVTKITENTVFTKTEYYEDNPLGIAGNFHLIGFNSVKTGTHTNGNIMTKTLYYNSNFGTNGLSGEVSYIQNIGNDISSFQFSGDPDKVIVVGKDVTVGATDNGNAWTLNGAKVDNPSKSKYPNSIMQDSDDVQFIDINAVKDEMICLNKTMADYEDYGVTKELTDRNQQNITIQNSATANVVNLTSNDFNINNPLTVKGFEKGKHATLIINMDLKGISSFSFAGSEIEYTDGTKASHGEVTQWQDGNVVWNFYDSSANDGMYHGKISNTRATAGLIVAPEATVDLTQNFNGTVIANDIIVSAESHRTDFTGKTVVPGGKDGQSWKETDTETTEVEVKLEWDGTPAVEEATATLTANDEEVETTVLSEENDWEDTFEDLDKFDEEGDEITYDVQLDEVEGYTQTKNVQTRMFTFRRVKQAAPKVETYTVTFLDEDGTELNSMEYESGDIVTYPETPSKDSKENCSYTFSKWKLVEGTELGENGEVYGNAVYKASYTEACKYVVKFVDYDDTVLAEDTYDDGSSAVVPPNPIRESGTTEYTYEFDGWELADGTDISNDWIVDGNATYKATYHTVEPQVRHYIVEYRSDDGSLISSYEYNIGDDVILPPTPTKEGDGTSTYTFSHWQFMEGTELSAEGKVQGDATYQAVFDESHQYTVIFEDDDQTEISSTVYNNGF